MNVHVTGVEPCIGNHHPDTRSGDAGEALRRTDMSAKTVHTHDCNGGTAIRRCHRDGFDRQHMVGAQNRHQRRGRQNCRVAAEIGVVGTHGQSERRNARRHSPKGCAIVSVM